MKRLSLAVCLCLAAQNLSAADLRTLDGIWRTDGYGVVLEIDGGAARLFNLGADLCLPETETAVPLGDLLPGSDLQAAPDGQSLTIGFPLEPHRIRADRLASLPSICARTIPNTPVAVLDTVAALFEASYPFFELYEVDWPARVAEARDRMQAEPSAQSLFETLSWLLRPIRDGHVALTGDIDGVRHSYSAHPARILRSLQQAALAEGEDPRTAVAAFRRALWHDSIRTEILGGRGHMTGNDRIQYGMLSDGVGYLALATMGGFGPQDATPEADLLATQVILDEIMSFFALQGARLVILDLSLNVGGSDYVAREIARRFVHIPTLAYTKFAADAQAPIETRIMIAPSPRPRFHGDVILLTSHATVSAAEVLTLSLRGLPHVTQVGEATRGAFSDALSRRLPNGWYLHLSNEVYLDAAGRSWEAVGLTPERDMPVFSPSGPIASHRKALDRIVHESQAAGPSRPAPLAASRP